MIIALSILSVILLILCLYFCNNPKKVNREIENQNYELQEKHTQLEKDISNQKIVINNLQEQKDSLMADIAKAQDTSNQAFVKYQDLLEQSYKAAEEEYDRLVNNLKQTYNTWQDSLLQKREQQEILYQQKIESIQQEIQKIKQTRDAILEAQRREELIKLEKDSYRVVLTQTELTTIDMINELKPRLPEPRILCMLVWQTFYQKKFDALCKRILGTDTICGIYKITNIKNNMCYIGQSRDMDKRWKDHMKCALGIDTPAGVKLYQAMKTDGPDNFTFELLETCPFAQLNEKEKFYIDLYQSKDYGYNSTKGGS